MSCTRFRSIAILSLFALITACQTPPPVSPDAVGEYRKGSGYLNGYLPQSAYPDSLALLPPPPAEGSAAEAADIAAHRAARVAPDSPRWKLAADDAVLSFPDAAGTFACALGVQVSETTTPNLYMLLRRTLMDAGLSTYAAKDRYNRQRPYAKFSESTCFPPDEKRLVTNGSYPSGHAASGWAWALVLTAIAPERTDALLARGHAFGQSRSVCGYHWQSDIDAGRLIGAAAVARLQSDTVFLAQSARARAEIAAAKAAGLAPQRDCAAESRALGR